jgi:primase-polymerase (primpol)-like protein/biotin operon repressor
MAIIEGIPDELKKLNQWVCWNKEIVNGKETKIPYIANKKPSKTTKASVDNPETWSSYGITLVSAKLHKGIGFVFTKDDPYCFIDLDKCVDKKTDVIESWALDIIEKLQSYTERSQSYIDPEKDKYGIHIIVKAKLPEGAGNRKGNFEIYTQGRYCAMTGNVLTGYPVAIEERQEQVNQICSEIFKKPEQKPSQREPSTITLSDQEILTITKNDDKFNRLMSGQWQGEHPSQSEADSSLCCKLAFYTTDKEQIDRMFRTSRLYNTIDRKGSEKHGDDYIALTINYALSHQKEHYKPGTQSNHSQQAKKQSNDTTVIETEKPEDKSKNPKVSEFDRHKPELQSILSKHDLNTDIGKKSALHEAKSYINPITNPIIASKLWDIVNKELNLTDVERDIELTFKSAEDLEKMDLPEISWIVPGIIPEGLTLLCGKPKTGKSWLALGLSVAIASGGKAFSSIDLFEHQGSVLYLALEDNDRRMKQRLSKLCMGEKFPKKLIYTTEIKRGTEGVKSIRAWLEKNKEDARLVVIDTFVSFRGKASSKMTNEYERDSSDMQLIQRLAGEFGIGIIIIHHLRKAIAEDDFDTISGTLGLTGKADTNLILKRTRGEADAVLMGTGRDLDEDIDIALKFDTSIASWVSLGNAGEYLISKEKKAIIDIISKSKDEPLSPKEIAETLGKRTYIIQTYLGRLMDDGLIVKTDRGRYKVK